MFNTQLRALIVSDEPTQLLALLRPFFSDIQARTVQNGQASLLSDNPNLIFFDRIPAEELLRFRKENYQTRFILIDPHPDDDPHLLARCQLTQIVTDPEKDSLHRAIREAEEELDNLQKNFLVHLDNNFAWHRQRRLLYDNTRNPVRLTRNETLLMELFIQHSNRTLSNDTLLQGFEERGESINVRTLRNLITFLRKKLSNGLIQNIYGEGYRFIPRSSEQRLNLESFHTLSTMIQNAGSEKELHQNFCDTLLPLFGCDRAFSMYIDTAQMCIRVPYEASVKKYPGAQKMHVDIPLTPVQTKALEKVTNVEEPVVLGEALLKQAELDHPEVWRQMVIPRSALVSYFLLDGTVWIAGLHQCSHERRWAYEEIVFLKYAVNNLHDKLQRLRA